MNRSKNAAQMISFRWTPTVYPTTWVESVEELLWFDPSCGTQLDDLSRRRSKYKSSVPPSNLIYPRLARASPPPSSYLLDALEREEQILYEEETPLGSLRSDMRDEQIDEGRIDLSSSTVIDDVLQLTKKSLFAKKQSQTLRKAVFKLAQRYGPPYRHDDHTLEAWKRLAVRIQAEVWFYREVQSSNFMMAEASLLERLKSIAYKIWQVEPYSKVPDSFKYFDTNLFTYVLVESRLIEQSYSGDPTDLQYVEFCQLNAVASSLAIARYQLFAKNSQASPRIAIAEAKHNAFGKALRIAQDAKIRPEIIWTANGFQIDCTLGIWLNYKLAEMWMKNETIAICPVCGTCFVQSRKDRKYCKRGNCANKVRDSKNLPNL